MATSVRRLTWDDLVLLPEERVGDRQELIDGDLVVTPVSTLLHQVVLQDATRSLVNLVCEANLGLALPVPVGVRFTPDNVVQPDAVFVARRRKHVIGDEAIDAAPDMIVEVVSPETRQRDLTTKRALYARFGVQEYWIIDPEERAIEILALEGDRYVSLPANEEGVFGSRVLHGLVITGEVAFGGIDKLWGPGGRASPKARASTGPSDYIGDSIMATTAIRLTVDDLDLIPEERAGDRHELIGGELFVTPVPLSNHQTISFNLTLVLGLFVRERRLGAVRVAPSGVRLHHDTLLIPDLCFVAQDRLDIIGEKTIDGPPDLVIEILSPGTRRRDLHAKRELYARFGVSEYWIVDPDAKTVTALALSDGRYEQMPVSETGMLPSRVLPGLELTLEQVFADV